MGVFCNYNGHIIEENTASISINNRSFRYGDGCFETIKVIAGKAPLWSLHMRRLFSSLQTLGFQVPDFFTADFLHSATARLLEVNGHVSFARVRLVIFSGDSGLFEADERNLNFILQTWPGKEETNRWNSKGLHLAIFNEARISADNFSRIKSNNYLRSGMAAMHATKKGYDDCILTNAFNRIADTAIANFFIVSDGIVKTPPLTEGSVDGVMRRYLLQSFTDQSIDFCEQEITASDLFGSSEVFITNAINGIRWVKQVEDKQYGNTVASALYTKFIAPLWKDATI